jgi:hypothetical protein
MVAGIKANGGDATVVLHSKREDHGYLWRAPLIMLRQRALAASAPEVDFVMTTLGQQGQSQVPYAYHFAS